MAIIASMENVGTAELKNGLSRYLQKVRKGGRLVITDHGKPVAKLVPVDTGQVEDDSTVEERIARLVRENKIVYRFLPKKPITHRKITLGEDLASRAVAEDRV